MKKRKTGIKAIDVVLTICVILMAGVAVLFLLLPFLLLACFGLYVAELEAFDAAPDQIMFLNESSAVVCSVTVNDTVITDDILQLGESITVDWEEWPAVLTIYGDDGILGQIELAEEPRQDTSKDCWYIFAQDGPEGLILTKSHVEKLEKYVESMGERVNLDLSGGVVTLYDAPGRGIQGDGHDFMIQIFDEEAAAALEAQMETALGWHPYEDSELLDNIFFSKHSYCVNYITETPRPEKGWFFFRDTYNAQHGANDEGQWSLQRVGLPQNYTAAIYDSETNTLYIFDLDT